MKARNRLWIDSRTQILAMHYILLIQNRGSKAKSWHPGSGMVWIAGDVVHRGQRIDSREGVGGKLRSRNIYVIHLNKIYIVFQNKPMLHHDKIFIIF